MAGNSTVTKCKGAHREESEGKVTVKYTASEPGTIFVYVQTRGGPIVNSPFQVKVDSVTDMSKSKMTGSRYK